MTEPCAYLQADACSAYDQLYPDLDRSITKVACWANARRLFSETRSSGLMRSMVLLAYIRLPHHVERGAPEMGLAGGGPNTLRHARSLTILAGITLYLERSQPAPPPKGPDPQPSRIRYRTARRSSDLAKTETWMWTTTVPSTTRAA